MRRFDVCNGDADGLCAVVQWRLHEPAAATLLTGLKREIELLRRVPVAAADEVLVCDLSMQRNQEPLRRLLEAGVRVRYFDHHQAGDVPDHPLLDAHLDFGADACTSLLVDRFLGGSARAWAAVGAYGDALEEVGDRLAGSLGLGEARRRQLRQLGEAINYNAYGEDAGDVRIAPADLYRIMIRYHDPLDMCAVEPIAAVLDRLRRDDLVQALAVEPVLQTARCAVRFLPDLSWSRRAIGCLANEVARAHPGQAQAVLKATRAGDFTVSVRAPLDAPAGAAQLCARFGGAGRAAAAGIDRLPAADVQRFVEAFEAAEWLAVG